MCIVLALFAIAVAILVMGHMQNQKLKGVKANSERMLVKVDAFTYLLFSFLTSVLSKCSHKRNIMVYMHTHIHTWCRINFAQIHMKYDYVYANKIGRKHKQTYVKYSRFNFEVYVLNEY